MKKGILIFLFSIISINFSLGQNKIKFKPGVQIIENSFKTEYKNPESILFVFNIVGCQANFYMNLAKNLKKRFKRTNTKVKFNFNINTKLEIEQIPKKKHSEKSFELICFVSTSNMNSWDNHLIEKRKQNYNLNLLFEKIKTKEKTETIKLNINSYYTIITQNKNSGKLICKLITE
ncbi:hypothetical protein RRF68_04860 [Tenacibaculum sp. HL-MS23]|uniref:hypothetical protein n=1 Tax=Tenacibaculum sp. HL-MS23 TaxID=3077734 RepID=UPI0028FC0CF3|nr:hypothetical protein [Tenacibaculum sp. HL-MS23]WNW02743.1 hypothetical protein RRF68_04860 [Tenacibaculum sp. HL-MS23]